VWVERLRLLRGEGYEEIALSGGEPLLYGDLARVLEVATDFGFRVSLITNGTVVTETRARLLARHGVRVAVSIDGRPAQHDQQRGAHTFRRAMDGAARLGSAGVTWGIAHCVTAATLPSLPWLADLAVSEGASILQIRPMVSVGRARGRGHALAIDERRRVLAIAHLLQVAHAGVLQVQCDLAPVDTLREGAPLHGVLRRRSACESRHPLSDLVNPLVVDAAGGLWPLAYGMAEAQRIASPDQWTEDIESYSRRGWVTLAELLRRLLSGLRSDDVTDWYAEAVHASRAPGATRRANRNESLPIVPPTDVLRTC